VGFVLRDASPSSCGMMRARLFILATLGACAALFASAVAAQTRFEVRSAYIEPSEGVYQLNATVDFELPEGARAALRDGVPLTLHLEIVVKRQRNYWLDETVAALEQDYELVHHALSERYLVRNLNSAALKNCLRVTVGTPEENRILLNALREALQ